MQNGEKIGDNGCGSALDRRLFTGGLIAASIAGVGAGAGVFGPLGPLGPVVAFAEPTSAEKQAEADEVRKKLDAWAIELDALSGKYYQALEAHDAAVAAMDRAQRDLEEAQAEVARLQERLGARAAAMYKQGKLTFLEVLFGAHSFTEFTSTWDLLNNINNSEAALIELNKDAKLTAQTLRDEFYAQERLAAEKLSEADEIRIRAEKIAADFEAELVALEAEVAALIQKEKEEEERRAREAAAAAARAAESYGGLRGDGIPIFSGGVTDIICQAAESRLGCPYVWAAAGPNTFDCSGLTQWCYAQAGIYLPHYDIWQRDNATSILPVSEALPGDVLWEPGHVGIYMGGGAYIHAPQPGDVVRYGYNMAKWSCTCRY